MRQFQFKFTTSTWLLDEALTRVFPFQITFCGMRQFQSKFATSTWLLDEALRRVFPFQTTFCVLQVSHIYIKRNTVSPCTFTNCKTLWRRSEKFGQKLDLGARAASKTTDCQAPFATLRISFFRLPTMTYICCCC
jgi:hypothetical protein